MWQTNSRNLRWSSWAVILVVGLVFAGWACPSEPEFNGGQNTGEPELDAGDDATDGGDDASDGDVAEPDPDAADTGDDVDDCVGESHSELCEEEEAECGEIEVVDACGAEVTAECGMCSGEKVCEEGVDEEGHAVGENECGCIPDEKEDICHDHECGEHPDGCGGTVRCGNCDEDENCQSGVDEQGSSCVHSEEVCEALTCDDIASECGEFSDGCGGVIECGCGDDEECVEQECECIPESHFQFCSRQDVECEQVVEEDNCGEERDVYCYQCVGYCTSWGACAGV